MSLRDFDIILLVVLLRNFCGLIFLVIGWDVLFAVIDLSCEVDIVRVKYFRNIVYGYVLSAIVDDVIFSDYW